jgi:putative DNA primase/helicase
MDATNVVQVSEVSQVQAVNDAVAANTLCEIDQVLQVSARAAVIPSEGERPSFRVFDEWHTEAERKYRSGVWHFGVKAGKADAAPTLTEQWVCSPLHIDAVTTDAQDGNYGRQLRLRSTLGKWMTWSMPMELLRGDGSDLRGVLLAMGSRSTRTPATCSPCTVSPRPRAAEFSAAFRQGGRVRISAPSLLPDEVIGPQSAEVAYQSGERGQDDYTIGGRWSDGSRVWLQWRSGTHCWRLACARHSLDHCSRPATPKAAASISLVIPQPARPASSMARAAFGAARRTAALGERRVTDWNVAALFNDSLLALDEIG